MGVNKSIFESSTNNNYKPETSIHIEKKTFEKE